MNKDQLKVLSLVPVSLREANEFVRQHHRHHKPTVGHKFSIGVRAARAMGYHKVITYILDSECGASLKASGFVCEGPTGGMEWTGRSRPRDSGQYPHQMKTRWVKILRQED